MPEDNAEQKKKIDEEWKETAKKEVDEAKGENGEDRMPPTDFLSFITSLGLQAMIFMGEIPNPLTNQKEENLKQARFLIDTLLMLKGKTQGNLAAEETKALEDFIYELQMRYVVKEKNISK